MQQITNLNLQDFVANETLLQEELKAVENWRDIPLLNHTQLHDLKDGTLVRFRGMIQDMLDNETYLEQYEVLGESNSTRIQNGKYRDCFVLTDGETVNHSAHGNAFGERRTMFVVSVPGINTWALDYESSRNAVRTEKSFNSGESSQGGQKRSLIEEEEEMDTDTAQPVGDVSANKRLCTQAAPQNGTNSLSSEYLLNSPIPDRPSKACMIKIYSDFDSHILNSVVDVIGFLSVDPAMDGSTLERSDDPYMEMDAILAANPPPSLIPRLHAIAVRPIVHLNPLLDSSLSPLDDSRLNVEALYKDLKIVLTQCLFGDALAAEYLLAHLISTVYVRTELETLGQFTLNLCNIPGEVLPEYTKQLYEVIESLLPVSHYLPMSLENMNTLQFVPKKDYNTNKLTSGILQLAPHTHLVLDETSLQPGKLEANGVRGVQSLAHLIKSQQIKCDFQYYEIDFHANISILVFSEGRSMLPHNSQFALKIDHPESIKLIPETLKAAKHYLQPKLNSIRKYLTNAKIQEFTMKPEDNQMIENDFVQMRKENKKIGADELHNLLVLSRLMGIAQGKVSLDNDTWNLAKEMEKERQLRLEQLPKRKI